MWTQFMDMHSGGGLKEKWQFIYIEATKEQAKIIFYNRFKHNAERVSCTCCGPDYSISSEESLEKLTGFERGCKYDEQQKCYVEQKSDDKWGHREYKTLEEYMHQEDCLFISAAEIQPKERKGNVPVQGYVWK